MKNVVSGVGADREYVGFRAAAAYLGLRPNTLSHYANQGVGPKCQEERRAVKGWLMRVYRKSDLDAWAKGRVGRGARVDLDLSDRARGYAAIARYLNVHPPRLHKIIENGELPGLKWVDLGGKRTWPEVTFADMDEWKAKQKERKRSRAA